ncbi:MAG TPA: helix-turn-helix domain-containing protein, partial [Verrucomicrobiae bacterium]|nr:helix-turn-helix domain-containing protein [Verrucomicrobiae bacterium]
WPGNVRELENVIERGVILARGARITLRELPIRTTAAEEKPAEPRRLVPLEEVEREHILHVLDSTGFHKSRSAEILGISRKTLDRKIAEFNLEAK